MPQKPASTCAADHRPTALRDSLFAAVIAAAVLTPGAATASDESIMIRTVAVTGDAAPGTSDGAQFDSFMSFVDPSGMVPHIDADGSVAFVAILSGGQVGSSNRSGIWSEAGGALDLVVRTGMQAPGVEPGLVFAGFPNEYIPFVSNYTEGHVAFAATLDGEGLDTINNNGTWVETDTGIELLVRHGAQVPGLPDGVILSQTGLYGMDTNGTGYLFGMLLGSGVTLENNHSLLQFSNGQITPVLREGDPAPGFGNGVVIGVGQFSTANAFGRIAFNDRSQLAVSAAVKGDGVTRYDDEVLYLQDADSGEFVVALREGDPAPVATPGVKFGGNENRLMMSQALNSAGQIAFSAQIGGTASTQTAIFSNVSGAMSLVAMAGDPAPGTDTAFAFVRVSPLLSESGGIAFVAVLTGGSPYAPAQGVWRSRDGAVIDVLLPGAVVTRPNQSVLIERVSSIVGFNARDDVVARALLDDGTGLLRWGLVMRPADGDLTVLVAVGDHFDVHGDGSELREVLGVTAGGLNESGEFAFRIDFTGGSSGHFVAAPDRDGDGITDARDNCTLVPNPDQRDTSGDGYGNICDADLDGDGIVSPVDLGIFRSAFFTADPHADFNGDGVVNPVDLGLLRSMFFSAPGPSGVAP